MKTLLPLLLTIVITTPAYCQSADSVENRAQLAEQVRRFEAMAAAAKERYELAFDLKPIDQPQKPTDEDFLRYERDAKAWDKRFQDDNKDRISNGMKPSDVPAFPGPAFPGKAINVGDFGRSGIVLGSTIQVVDDETILVRAGEHTLWVTGYSTEGLTAKRDVKCTACGFKATGTKTYQTSVGTNTVFVVEPFDYDNLLKNLETERQKAELLAKETAEREKRAVLEERREHRTRKFTDLSGKFSVEAEYLEYKDGKVSLRRLDNDKVLAIPLSKLSDADRKWVSEELAWERKNLR